MSEQTAAQDHHRAAVRALFLDFCKGFNEKPPHDEKVNRYIDVLESIPLDNLKDTFDSLKGERSIPSPDEIKKEAREREMIREMMRRAAERKAQLELLADPVVRAQMRADLAAKAGGLLHCESVLDQLVQDAEQLGLVGEDRAAKLLYLALQTRHFDEPGRPVSVVVKGDSSAGKSYTVKTISKFMSPGSVIEMSGMSPKWMVYAGKDGLDFSHKFLFVHEASGIDEEVEGMLRVLLSEGRTVWRTVIEQVAFTLVVEGPTGLVETTTRLSLNAENETRMLSVPVSDDTEQTRRVLVRMGKGPKPVDFSRWHALDRWVALGSRAVAVPFQPIIGKLARPEATRVRRDLTTLLELVRAHALLHEAQRELDGDGRVLATLDDYRAVFVLTRELFAFAVEMVVPKNVREVVEMVAVIIAEKLDGIADSFTTAAEVARRSGKHRKTVTRAIQAALASEYLEDVNPRRNETQAFRVRIGPRLLPEENASVFPTPEDVRKALVNGHALDATDIRETAGIRNAETTEAADDLPF